jgi:LacI family transcriptional regulator
VLNRILKTRGINGLLVYGANAEIHQWALDWEQFAAVAYAGSLHEHFIHNVMSSSYQDLYDAMIQLYERGYSRAGFFIIDVQGHLDYWLAGYVTALQSLGKKKNIPNLKTEDHPNQKGCKEKFLFWFNRYKPDLILTNTDDRLLRVLAAEGIRVPEDVGVFCVDIVPSMMHLSGFHQLRDVAYQVMVDLLHGMLMRHEFGPPGKPYCIQIPPRWNEGETLRTAQGQPTRSAGSIQ